VLAVPSYAVHPAGIGWTPTYPGYVGTLVVTGVALGAVAVGARRLAGEATTAEQETAAVERDHRSSARVVTRETVAAAAATAVLTLLVGAVIVLVARAVGGPIPEPTLLRPALEGVRSPPAGPVRILAALPAFVLVVVPAEELLFRGTIQGLLARRLSEWGAVVATSGLYAAFVVPAFAGSGVAATVVAVVTAFALSLLWGVAARRTGSLFVPVAAHAAPYVVGSLALYALAVTASG
jgi:membrane protease YdiL (CAAX protease family)